MILGGLAVIAGLLFQLAGQLLAYLAWPFVVYTIRVVELFAWVPSGEVAPGEVALLWVILYYALLLGVTFAMPKFPSLRSVLPPAAALTGLAVFAIQAWSSVLSLPDGRLHLIFLDVSAAGKSVDAVFLTTPRGRYVLVDGGPSLSMLSDGLGRRLPPGKRELDWLVVAAGGEGQVGALPRLLDRFPPGQVLWAGPTHGTYYARTLQSALVRQEIAVVQAEAGHVLELGDGAQLEVLTAGRRGAVLLLEWGSFKAVLPVGASWDDFSALMRREDLRSASVLLLADGGYALTNPPDWIEWLQPQVVVLSAASGDRRGLPDAATLAALEDHTLLRTDQNGWIEITTDGQKMWVEAAR